MSTKNETKEEKFRSLLSRLLVDEQRSYKIRRFADLLADGREFFYDPFQDKVYADVNLTLTDAHLGARMLEYWDPEVASKAGVIMRDHNRSKRSRVISIAKLTKGKTIVELQEASEKAAWEINVPEYFVKDLANLKPTRLVLMSDTPIQTIDVYKELKINPIYNSSGKPLFITMYATELEHANGTFTGEIRYIPDELERHKIQTLEQLHFLNRHLELIA